jgi:hypothetical protein
VTGEIGEAGERSAQAMVAGPAEGDSAVLAGLVGDGGHAGLGGELRFIGEALAHAAQLGEDLRCADAPAAGEGHDDLTVSEVGEGVLYACGELGELRHQALENRGEAAHELSLGLGFELASATGGSSLQPLKQHRDRAATAVAVLCKEARQALLSQPRGALRRGVAGGEGERDRRVDVGEDLGSAGPEGLKEASELIGQRHALGNQLVSGAHERPQCANLIALRFERPEPMAVSAQDVSEHISIARIALAGAAVTSARGLQHIGVNRYHAQPRLHQRVDEQPRGSLDGDGDAGEALKLADEPLDAFFVMRQIQPKLSTAEDIEYANGVRLARPIDTCEVRRRSHGQAPWCWSKTSRAGRLGGELIDRRSGFSCRAQHPVSRLSLPAPSAQRVSQGPSSGQPPRLSQKVHGSLSTSRSNSFESVNAVTHRLARSIAYEALARSLWITADVNQ